MNDLVLCTEKAAEKQDAGRAAQERDQPVFLLPEGAAMEQKSSATALRTTAGQHSSRGRALASDTARDSQPGIRDSSQKNLSLSVTARAGPVRLLEQLRGEGTSTRGHAGTWGTLFSFGGGWLLWFPSPGHPQAGGSDTQPELSTSAAPGTPMEETHLLLKTRTLAKGGEH